MVVDQVEQLHGEGAKRPRVLSIAIHPFLIGHPFRARYLDKALQYLKRKKGVWIATGSEILDWWTKASQS
jgi:peptidoglycan/xylan/chitin deacetylase (PgdA/CDA1 family)